MAEKKPEEAKATSEQKAGADADAEKDEVERSMNPVDLGTDVDKLPPVPGAGQFMTPEESAEPIKEAEAPQQKRG